jgi:transposase
MYFTLGMPNPYDESLRQRVIRAYEAGEGTYEDLAALFALGARTIQRWVVRYRAEGTLVPLPKGGGWHSPIQLPVLHRLIAEAPDATCAELCWAYNRQASAAHQTTPSSLWRAMRRAGYVLKKNGHARARSTGPTSSGSAPRTDAGVGASIPVASSSSMKPARTSRWAARTPGSRRAPSTSSRGR